LLWISAPGLSHGEGAPLATSLENPYRCAIISTDLARRGDLCKAGESMVLAADAVQQRSFLEQRANELVDLVGDARRHALFVPRRFPVFSRPAGIDWLAESR
jgi:hypothetical protein